MLKSNNRHHPHKVRKHFAEDLCKFVKACKQNNKLVIVGGDFNETLGDTIDGLTKLCNECDLVDVHNNKHGTDTHTFKTFIRGNKCIDYILADSELLSSVKRCGYKPFKIRIDGDHRGVYIDVNIRMFFGSNTTPLAPSKARHLQTRRVNQIVPYFEDFNSHMTTHNWHNQINQLQTCIDNNTRYDYLAEKLDRRRIAGCQYAAGRLKRYPKTSILSRDSKAPSHRVFVEAGNVPNPISYQQLHRRHGFTSTQVRQLGDYNSSNDTRNQTAVSSQHVNSESNGKRRNPFRRHSISIPRFSDRNVSESWQTFKHNSGLKNIKSGSQLHSLDRRVGSSRDQQKRWAIIHSNVRRSR